MTNRVKEYLNESDWEVNENGNIGYSHQGLFAYLAGKEIKDYWLNDVYPSIIKKAVEDGRIHIHDLNFLGCYCSGWDLADILKMGFGGVDDKLSCKPPKHMSSALGQIVNFFYTIATEVAGATSFSNFDTMLCPFIAFDGLDRDALKQILQEFMFNMSVPTKIGGQTPFTNISFDMQIPVYMKDEIVLVDNAPTFIVDDNGEMRYAVYGDFKKEIDLFNEVWWELCLEGDASGKPFTFPIPTISITDEFDWDSKVANLIFEATRKYGIPYFSSFLGSNLRPEERRSLCCRLSLDVKQLKSRNGGIFASDGKTGSIGVVTINFPQLGYLSKDKADFFMRLGKIMDLCRDSLEIKRRMIEGHIENGLYPFSRVYLQATKDCQGKYYANHFSSIGTLGMNEMCWNFLNRGISDGESLAFVCEVLDFMRSKLSQFQEETGNLYNLEEVPGEGTVTRFAQMDKARWPSGICANEEDWRQGYAPFYSNSSHLPVDFTNNLLVTLVHQGLLKEKYTGGSVVHVFVDEEIDSTEKIKELVQTIASNYNIPYFTFTPTYSTCRDCGVLPGKHLKCPKCGGECQIWSRVVGYLRPVQNWNVGKRREFEQRKGYKL